MQEEQIEIDKPQTFSLNIKSDSDTTITHKYQTNTTSNLIRQRHVHVYKNRSHLVAVLQKQTEYSCNII